MISLKRLTRQMDLIPLAALNEPITIIGAGAIGSHTSMALAKMGLTNQSVWDFDSVDELNGNAQGYCPADIGKPKVLCLAEDIKEHTGDSIQTVVSGYEGQPLSGIVISAVDSMAARLVIWNKVKNNPNVKYFIDPRMSIEYALMYTVDPNKEEDIKMYECTLYTDSNSVQEPCTMKSVIYTAYFISGLICKTVKDIITNKDYPRVCTWDIANNELDIVVRGQGGRNNRAAQAST